MQVGEECEEEEEEDDEEDIVVGAIMDRVEGALRGMVAAEGQVATMSWTMR